MVQIGQSFVEFDKDGNVIQQSNPKNVIITDGTDNINIDENGNLIVTIQNATGDALFNCCSTAGFVKLCNGTDVVSVDDLTKNLAIIDTEHLEIHTGKHYTWHDYDANVDTGTAKYWHLKTPDTATRYHINYEVRSSKNGLFEFYENPTMSTTGDYITPYNNNRTSVNTSDLDLHKDATVSADGTLLSCGVMGTDGASPIGDSGGDNQRRKEFILKPNEDYIFKYTTQTDDNRVSLEISYYEVG